MFWNQEDIELRRSVMGSVPYFIVGIKQDDREHFLAFQDVSNYYYVTGKEEVAQKFTSSLSAIEAYGSWMDRLRKNISLPDTMENVFIVRKMRDVELPVYWD